MPTTSNFGWTTPADTDLVKDGAAAIRTLGNGIDTSFLDLKGGTTGQNLRKASNTDLDFTFAGDATNTVVDAAGDLLYGTAADTLGRLAIGTAGQVLKVNSGATAPEWAAAPSAGKILQVVNATYGTEVLLMSSTFTDTGLTATITPTSATSTILILVNHTGVYKAYDNATNSMGIRLMRGATSILEFEKKAGFTNTSIENAVGSASTSYVDSPSTTSATTYKTQFKNFFNGTNVRIQYDNSISTITLLEIGA